MSPVLYRSILFLLLMQLSLITHQLSAAPFIELPRSGLPAEEIAVIYLQNDKASLALAEIYLQARGIPRTNLFAVKLDAGLQTVNPGQFAVEHTVLKAKLGDHIQAFVLAWDQPYQVGCMSMTSAFAFGYDVRYCARGCVRTRISPYYHTTSTRPWTDFQIRPAMMLAAGSQTDNKLLIERGVLADDTMPAGKVILLQTSDQNRSVRARYYPEVKARFSQRAEIIHLQSDAVFDEDQILSYVTGVKKVEGLETLEFLPGALADHLTSAGGQLTNSSQMSAVEWLQAGATASYGTAIEPCNFVEKFPNPVIKLWHYLRGASAIEAYWKSVRMPGQGNFIGEPLASPYRGYRLKRSGSGWEVHSPVLTNGRYTILAGELGNEEFLATKVISTRQPVIVLEPPFRSSYIFKRVR